MPATSVSAVENYIPVDGQKNRRRFQRPRGKFYWMKNKERERERGWLGEKGRQGKNGMDERASRQVVGSPGRDEVKRVSNHITRGTLPNPISMSPVVLFSPACLRSPEPSRPTPASISPERTVAIQPSLDYNRALTSRSTVRFPAPSLVPSRLTPSSDPRPNRSGARTRWIINRVPLSMANRG